MTSPEAPMSSPVRLEGNTPLPLDGAHAWHVESGSVAIFRAGDGASLERRRHLVSLDAGARIYWQSLPQCPTVVVVAIEPAVLVPYPMPDAVAGVARGVAADVESARGWVRLLSHDRASGEDEREPALGADVASPAIAAWLGAVQTAFVRATDAVDRAREAAARDRFQQRLDLNARVTEETLSELTRVGTRRADDATASRSMSALAQVARQVGAACGIDVRIPAGTGHRGQTLDAILDASGARKRHVLLKDAWWAQDGEPLIGTVAASGEPIGLVPIRRGWFRGVQYRAFVADGPPRDVDADLAATVATSAFALQPPMVPPLSTSRVIAWSLRGRGPEFITAVLSGIAMVLLGMVVPQATKILFEFAIPDADRHALFELGMAVLAATIGAALFDLARGLSLLRLAAGAAARMQLGLWDRLLDQSPTFFRRFTAGDLDSRVSAVTQIRSTLSVTTLGTLIGGAAATLNVGLLFSYSAPLTVAALIIAGVLVAGSIASSLIVRRVLGPLQDREGQLRGLVIQLIGAVPKLRIAGADTRAFAQWGRVYAAKMHLSQRVRTVTDRARLVHVLLPPLGTAALFYIAADDVFGASPTLSVGAFVAFSAAFGTFLAGITSLAENLQVLLGVAALWGRLQPILQTDPEVQGQRNPPGRLTGRVRLDHVTFRYRTDGPLTLDNVSIEAAPGECIALVGPSGSGKSTIVNLLLRFESPISGAVYFDDHDLKGLDILAVRQQLGVVSQENKILAGSIFENITVGALDATHDDAWEAARAAGIDDEIRQMPMGLHTFVAEGGANLSGGQRQRLLIARVLLRKPSLLILDEATSALDNRSQAIVTDSLNRLKTTRILIAHRLSTIRQADRIYVIQAGRVVQHGTFEALMREEGLFAKLMRRQVA